MGGGNRARIGRLDDDDGDGDDGESDDGDGDDGDGDDGDNWMIMMVTVRR